MSNAPSELLNNVNVNNPNDDEDYSDMPPLVYDDAPTPLYTVKDNVENVNNEDVEDEQDKESVPDKEEDVHSDDENEENEENEENVKDDNEDVKDDNDNEDVKDDNENVFVLSNDQHPIRYSSDLQTLCRWRDQLVKKETYTFGTDGAVYVSHAKNNKNNKNIIETTLLTYMDRNLLWNTERTLKTFTIHRINKI